jgi:hypothetical protein
MIDHASLFTEIVHPYLPKRDILIYQSSTLLFTDFGTLLFTDYTLTINDVYLLQYRSEVLDIINEENNSMLQEGEDDWVFAQEIKLRIRQKLFEYKSNIKDEREKDIIEYLLKLLEISIITNKSLYFIF